MTQLTRTPRRRATIVDSQAKMTFRSLSAEVMLLYVSTLRWQRAELQRARDAAHALARVDALTGLGNRRAFDEALQRECDRAARYGAPLSLILADLDDFKAINDQHGHPAGRTRPAALTDRRRFTRPPPCKSSSRRSRSVAPPACERGRAFAVPSKGDKRARFVAAHGSQDTGRS